jgi:hypothetical protein
MTAELLREAAALMRERAEAATPGPWMRAEPWDRAVGQVDGPWVAETTALGQATAANAEHIASWHPAVALAVADWLDAVAAVHWPKRHDRYSDSHYNAEPEHDHLSGDCDESCWTEAYICNGCGTAECKSEISGRALAVACAFLGKEPSDV